LSKQFTKVVTWVPANPTTKVCHVSAILVKSLTSYVPVLDESPPGVTTYSPLIAVSSGSQDAILISPVPVTSIVSVSPTSS